MRHNSKTIFLASILFASNFASNFAVADMVVRDVPTGASNADGALYNFTLEISNNGNKSGTDRLVNLLDQHVRNLASKGKVAKYIGVDSTRKVSIHQLASISLSLSNSRDTVLLTGPAAIEIRDAAVEIYKMPVTEKATSAGSFVETIDSSNTALSLGMPQLFCYVSGTKVGTFKAATNSYCRVTLNKSNYQNTYPGEDLPAFARSSENTETSRLAMGAIVSYGQYFEGVTLRTLEAFKVSPLADALQMSTLVPEAYYMGAPVIGFWGRWTNENGNISNQFFTRSSAGRVRVNAVSINSNGRQMLRFTLYKTDAFNLINRLTQQAGTTVIESADGNTRRIYSGDIFNTKGGNARCSQTPGDEHSSSFCTIEVAG